MDPHRQHKPTSTVEDYVKRIFLEQSRMGAEFVAMGVVSRALGVVPGTATTMVKSLADSGLVLYRPRLGVRLTRKGATLAIDMLRRHRLIEVFLVDVLGLDWSEIHDDAEQLEHAISDQVLDKIDALLGYPRFDPHGDPIPSAAGELDDPHLRTLRDCPVEDPVKIARISDQAPEFLQFATDSGLRPGVELWVRQRNQAADSVTVGFDDGATLTLGTSAAEKILVR